MIFLAFAGREEEVRHFSGHKWPIIAPHTDQVRPEQASLDGASLACLFQPVATLGQPLGADDKDPFAADPSHASTNHVSRHKELQVRFAKWHMGRKIPGAKQAKFFEVKRHKQDTPFRSILRPGKPGRSLQKHGHSAGVVVGSGIGFSGCGIVSQMVPMRRKNDPLTAQNWVAALNHGGQIFTDDLTRRPLNHLLNVRFFEARLESMLLKVIQNIGDRFLRTRPPTPGKLLRCQPIDMRLKRLGIKRNSTRWNSGRSRRSGMGRARRGDQNSDQGRNHPV